MKKRNNKSISMKLAGFLITVVIAGATLLFCLSFTKMPDKWTAPASADKMTNPVSADANTIKDGKVLYTQNCEQCHGRKGKGDGWQSTNIEARIGDLSAAEIKSESDGAIFWKITQGNKPMPSMKKDLSDEQRWKLVLYVREFEKLKAR